MSNQHTYVAIMAGGVGSRFWPGSRESRPKQFLDMLGVGKSLLQLTYERFLPVCPPSNFFIVTNAAYRDLVKEQLPGLSDHQILCEPSRNNTAPCIAYASFKIKDLDPQANIVITPSDHIVVNQPVFVDMIGKALRFAAGKEALVTLGIQPTRPDTGYGYIQYDSPADNGVYKVQRFTEKPDLATARQFLESGDYVWNAGIFIWNVGAILNAFEQLSPDIFAILQKGQGKYNTPEEQSFIDEYYPSTPNISVDFAILEKAGNVYTIPGDFGWSDLGTWASLHAECDKDENDNLVQGDKVMLVDTDNCLIRVPAGKLVIIKDLSDYIVVDTGDVLLIHPKSKEQEIKQVVGDVKAIFGEKYL